MAFGQDWNQPYSCSGWGTTFGLTHPIVDDINNVYGMFGIGYIPHNVIIGGDGEVLYSDAGYNQTAIIAIIEQALENLPSDFDEDVFDEDVDNCPENYNPTQADIDDDGYGDACDVCDNENVFVTGNVNGDIDMNDEPIIDFFDVVALLDHLQLSQSVPQAISECEAQSGNINGDNNVNIIDVVNLVNMLLFGSNPSAVMPEIDGGTITLEQLAIVDNIILESTTDIGGFQFDIISSNPISNNLEQLYLPDGWTLNYSLHNNIYRVFAYDQTGKNSIKSIQLGFNRSPIFAIENVVVSSSNGYEIPTDFKRSESEFVEIALPNHPAIHELYPNPFNPVLSISFSIPSEGNTTVTVYNMMGEKVVTLMDNVYAKAGFHDLKWNASEYPSGMYFIQVQTSSVIDTRKALFIK